jgi:hypothetical protein
MTIFIISTIKISIIQNSDNFLLFNQTITGIIIIIIIIMIANMFCENSLLGIVGGLALLLRFFSGGIRLMAADIILKNAKARENDMINN